GCRSVSPASSRRLSPAPSSRSSASTGTTRSWQASVCWASSRWHGSPRPCAWHARTCPTPRLRHDHRRYPSHLAKGRTMTIDHLLMPGAQLEKVAEGFTWTEGPAWIPARGALRFSDIPGNRVLEFEEADGTIHAVSTNAEFTNGRTMGRDGSVIECSHGRRAVQLDRTASQEGAEYSPEILVDRFREARLNSPNDVV